MEGSDAGTVRGLVRPVSFPSFLRISSLYCLCVRVRVCACSYDPLDGARFYGENLLVELDVPGRPYILSSCGPLLPSPSKTFPLYTPPPPTAGEYYVDVASNTLYFYPPAPVSGSDAFVSLGQLGVSMTSVAFVTLDGFAVNLARDTGISAQNVQVCECVLYVLWARPLPLCLYFHSPVCGAVQPGCQQPRRIRR